jgi:hypothetical protein
MNIASQEASERVESDARRNSPADYPRLAIRVGITGHRPDKLVKRGDSDIHRSVRQVLTEVAKEAAAILEKCPSFRHELPMLRIVSSLAEGADRIVAFAGLQIGFALDCPLPAHRETYRSDFKDDQSANEFDRLLSRAERVFELNGERDGEWLEDQAYEAAGRLMLVHSDILITIWDGDEGDRGGTSQIVKEAQRAGLLVIWINSLDPEQIKPLRQHVAMDADWRKELNAYVTDALQLPDKFAGELNQFVRESSEGDRDGSLKWELERADLIATRFAQRYRRTYKAIYWLAPLAVLCAVSGLWLSGSFQVGMMGGPLALVELVFIATILGLTIAGRHGRWHERWMSGRIVAEEFRIWNVLAPLGQVVATSAPRPYVASSPQRIWTDWYVRARIRERGMPTARITLDYLREQRDNLFQTVAGQIAHQTEKGRARHRIFERLELAELALFVLTALICATHLVLHMSHLDPRLLLATLGALTAALPPFASAMEGLQAQGEYQRLAERSEGMLHHLNYIEKRLRSDEALNYDELLSLAHQTSDIMLDEVADWVNLVRTRVLHIVG